MANYQDLMSLFADTASAIREKNGSNATYYPNQMPAAIRALSTGGTTLNNQSLTITPTSSKQTFTASGSVTGYTPVVVNAIPSSYIVPSGTYNITSNGTYSISTYSSVSVNVPIPTGYIQPTGTYTVTSAGTFDIKNYASLSVSEAAININYTFRSSMARLDYGYSITSSGYLSTKNAGQYKILPSTSISKITPSTASQTIPQYVWTLNEITVDAIPSSYIIPSGTSTITTNGTFNIASYASVSVAIPTGATISNYTAAAVTPTESSQTLLSGQISENEVWPLFLYAL